MTAPQPARSRALQVPPPIGDARADALRTLLAIVDRLRADDGCPWDREQTLATVAPHLVEEAHELLEAIEVKSDADVVEEAGDLLMGVCLLARIAEQAGRFDLARIAEAVSQKLIRRHPHVFGDVQVDSASEALANWERIKQRERAGAQADASALAGVPAGMGALQRAQRMGKKAVAAGFRWADDGGALDKLKEELAELEQALAGRPPESSPRKSAQHGSPPDELARARIEHELGDVLIAAAFLGNYLRIDPEAAARKALRRFETRFRDMEVTLKKPLQECTLEQMMDAWRAAKAKEAAVPPPAAF